MANLGSFDTLNLLWGKYPYGGREGDEAYIGGVHYMWNKHIRRWLPSVASSPKTGREHDTMNGNLTVGGDLTVGGVLRVHDLQNSSCGLFESEVNLKKSIPQPQVGYWAYVGLEDSANLFICEEKGVWKDTGLQKSMGVVVSEIDAIKSFVTKEIEKEKNELKNGLQQATSSIETLREDATSADRDLRSDIDNERSRIDEVDGKITKEATARIQDDANLLLKIQAEQRERVADDESLRQEMTNARQELQEYADRAGKVKAVSVNGQVQDVTEDGTVNLFIDSGMNQTAVDAAIEAKVSTLRKPRFNVDAEASDEGVTLRFSSEDGEEIATTSFAGGGNGGSQGDTAKITLQVVAENRILRKGTPCILHYVYNHLNSDGGETGVSAAVTITIQQGLKSPVVMKRTLQPSDVRHELDLSDYTKEAGSVTVRLSAVADDGLRKSAAVTLDVRELHLYLQSTEFISKTEATDRISVPFYVSGAGNKTVTMLVNGQQEIKQEGILSAGTTLLSLDIPSSVLTVGRNTVQMQAEADGLKSQCIYFDVYHNAGAMSPYIGLYIEDTRGELQRKDHLAPKIKAVQYEMVTFRFVGAGMDIITLQPDGKKFVVAKGLQTYTRRYKTTGTRTLTLSGGGASSTLTIEVGAASVSLGSSDVGVVADFDADGRSNEEAGKDSWVSGDYSVAFEDVDFVSSGWEEGALVLRSGAKAVIGYLPFESDPAIQGWTTEIELRTDTAMDEDVAVVSCMEGGKGFAIYPSKAVFYTGAEIEVQTEDGGLRVAEGLSMPLSTEDFTRIAFVVHKKADGALMELYADGVRVGAGVYGSSSSFVQSEPQAITLSSEAANVAVRGVKAYNRSLTDDEVLDSYIVSRPNGVEMKSLQVQNDVLNRQGQYEAPRTTRRGRLFIKRKGGLEEVFQCTDKKKDFLCSEVRWESPFGQAYDFVARNIFIRIQGTSSTKYPHKNIRLYLNKGENPQLWVGGVLVTGTSGEAKADAKKNKYKMSETAKAVSIFTCKCDYSDSSMTHNTGFARLWHQLCARLASSGAKTLTPPQQTDSTARTSIEGYPCDIYNQDEEGVVRYYGQYNFNNDKSKSDAVFGMDEIDKEAGACSLEFLNNTQPLCLFQTRDESDFGGFDSALEFNVPDDVKWSTATEGQRTAVKRLWNFIGRSVRNCGVTMDSPLSVYEELSRFQSEDFRRNASEYFEIDNLLLWYLYTDYLALVDQRAKNMILRTWDGQKWWFTYYDGDTALGVRNDSFLSYLYDVERGTVDRQLGKFAFEGYASWLWALVLANFGEELRAMAEKMRSVMTNELVFEILHQRQMGAWSKRAYNKSGELKYIIPAIRGTNFTDVGGHTSLVFSNYIHALQGDRQAHRRHFIKKRFAFLDAKYHTRSFQQDNIDGYISRRQQDSPCVIRLTAGEKYRFGYGTNNKPMMAMSDNTDKGAVATLQISQAFTVNDPIRIYGASAVQVLDLTGVVPEGVQTYPLQNSLVLHKCRSLRKIEAGLDRAVSAPTLKFDIKGLATIEEINVRNIQGVTIGNSAGQIDCSGLPRLKKLDARGTGAKVVSLFEGATLTEVYYPEEMNTLTLRSLPRLTTSGLHIANYATIERLNFAACPHLDWRSLLSSCTSLQAVRIEGVSLKGDGTDLDGWKRYRGLDRHNSVVAGARFVGRYQLTKWRDDLEQLRASFPEMDIRQAKYTAIEFDESIDANANITNLDNNTGARTSAKYVPSGHLMAIQEQRDRVLCKYDKAKGEVVFTRLNKADARLFADGTPAALDGTMGSVMIIEPEYWYKGINDFYHGKKYGLWTSVRPEESRVRRVSQREVMETMQGIRLSAAASYPESKSQDASYRSFVVALEGAKMVRWHSASSVGHDIAACFLRDDNSMVSQVSALSEGVGYHHGMYLIKEIPQGATRLAFCHHTKQLWEDVLLYDHTDILESEPDWVHHPACLVGAVLTSSSVTGEYQAVAGGNVVDFTDQAAQAVSAKMGAGWSALSYEMWKDIVLYIMAMRGERTCFAEVPYSRSTGDSLGEDMRHIYYIKNISDDPSKAYYQAAGIEQQTKTPHLLGYESWIGYKDQRVVGVSQAHGYNHNGSYSAFVLGGRKIPEIYIAQWSRVTSGDRNKTKSVIHGRYMDVLSASTGASGYYLNYCSDIGFAANESNVTSFVVCLSSIRWSRNLVCLLYMSPNQADVKSRLQYTGRMREVSNQEYKDLWR